MRILGIIGQVSLLLSLFIMLGFEFNFPVTGIPSAYLQIPLLRLSMGGIILI